MSFDKKWGISIKVNAQSLSSLSSSARALEKSATSIQKLSSTIGTLISQADANLGSMVDSLAARIQAVEQLVEGAQKTVRTSGAGVSTPAPSAAPVAATAAAKARSRIAESTGSTAQPAASGASTGGSIQNLPAALESHVTEPLKRKLDQVINALNGIRGTTAPEYLSRITQEIAHTLRSLNARMSSLEVRMPSQVMGGGDRGGLSPPRLLLPSEINPAQRAAAAKFGVQQFAARYAGSPENYGYFSAGSAAQGIRRMFDSTGNRAKGVDQGDFNAVRKAIEQQLLEYTRSRGNERGYLATHAITTAIGSGSASGLINEGLKRGLTPEKIAKGMVAGIGNRYARLIERTSGQVTAQGLQFTSIDEGVLKELAARPARASYLAQGKNGPTFNPTAFRMPILHPGPAKYRVGGSGGTISGDEDGGGSHQSVLSQVQAKSQTSVNEEMAQAAQEAREKLAERLAKATGTFNKKTVQELLSRGFGSEYGKNVIGQIPNYGEIAKTIPLQSYLEDVVGDPEKAQKIFKEIFSKHIKKSPGNVADIARGTTIDIGQMLDLASGASFEVDKNLKPGPTKKSRPGNTKAEDATQDKAASTIESLSTNIYHGNTRVAGRIDLMIAEKLREAFNLKAIDNLTNPEEVKHYASHHILPQMRPELANIEPRLSRDEEWSRFMKDAMERVPNLARLHSNFGLTSDIIEQMTGRPGRAPRDVGIAGEGIGRINSQIAQDIHTISLLMQAGARETPHIIQLLGRIADSIGGGAAPAKRSRKKGGGESLGSESLAAEPISMRERVRREGEGRGGIRKSSGFTPALELPPDERTANYLQRVVAWGSSAAVVYGGANALTGSVSAMTDFERRLIDVQKVMSPLGLQIDGVAKSGERLAQVYGQNVSDSLQGMQIYAQQGKEMADVVRETETAMLAANVTELSLVEATDALTAAQKQFQMQSTDSIRILDAWNEVENTTAVNARVLTEAVKASGSVARLAGIDFDLFNGIVAAIGEATRKSGSEIGNSLKFIFQHMRDPEAVKAFQDVGVAAVDATGRFRSARSILGELANRWDGLTEAQRQQVSVNVAGTRRLNDFVVLMENWDRAIDVSVTSLLSQGSAMRENELSMQSLYKQTEQLKASWNSLLADLGRAGVLDVLKSMVDLTKQLVTGFSKVNDLSGGALGGTLGTLALGGGVIGSLSYFGTGVLPSAAYKAVAPPQYGGVRSTRAARQQAREAAAKAAPGEPLTDAAALAALFGGGAEDFSMSGGRRDQPRWYRQARVVARRQLGLPTWIDARYGVGAALMSSGALLKQYGPQADAVSGQPTTASITSDVVSAGLTSAGLASMFNGGTKSGKIAIALTIAGFSLQAYHKLQEAFTTRPGSAGNISNQIDTLMHFERRLREGSSTTSKFLRDQKGGSDLDPAALADMKDTIAAFAPQVVTFDKAGEVLSDNVSDWTSGLQDATKAVQGQRGNLQRLLAQRIIESDETKKSVDRLKQLRQQRQDLIRDGGDVNALATNRAELAGVRSDLTGRYLDPMRAMGLIAGRSGQGLLIGGKQLSKQASEHGFDPEAVANDLISKYVQGASGSLVEVRKQLNKSGISAVQALDEGLVQIVEHGPIRSLKTGEIVKGTVEELERGGKTVIKAFDQVKGEAFPPVDALQTLVNRFDTAISRLLRRNDRVLGNTEFLNQVTASGEFANSPAALSATGIGSRNLLRYGQTLMQVQDQGVREFTSEPGRGRGGLQNEFTQLAGEVLKLSSSDRPVAMQGLVSAQSRIVDASRRFVTEIPAALDRMLESVKAGGPDSLDTADFEQLRNSMSAPEFKAFEASLMRVVEQLRSDDEGTRSEGEAGRVGLQQQLLGRVNVDVEHLLSNVEQAVNKNLAAYSSFSTSTIQQLATDFDRTFSQGKVGNVGEFLAGQGKSGADQIRGIADRMGDALEEAIAKRDAALSAGSPLADELQRSVDGLQVVVSLLRKHVDDLPRLVEQTVRGARELGYRLDLTQAAAAQGGAYGLTGTNEAQFSVQVLKSVRDTLLADDKNQAFVAEGIERLTRAIEAAEQSSKLERQQQANVRRGLLPAVLSENFGRSFGIRSNDALQRYVETEQTQMRELFERISQQLAPAVQDKSYGDIRSIQKQIQDVFAPQVRSLRELGDRANIQFQTDYTLAPQSTQLLVDQIRDAMRQGATAEDIFSNPYLKDAAREQPLVREMLERSLEQDLMKSALDYQRQTAQYTSDAAGQLSKVVDILNQIRAQKGLAPVTEDDLKPGGGVTSTPVISQKVGSLASAGTQAVDGEGRIRRDGTPAILHQGEIVLNKEQSDAFLNNQFKTGTLPRYELGAEDLESHFMNSPLVRTLPEKLKQPFVQGLLNVEFPTGTVMPKVDLSKYEGVQRGIDKMIGDHLPGVMGVGSTEFEAMRSKISRVSMPDAELMGSYHHPSLINHPTVGPTMSRPSIHVNLARADSTDTAIRAGTDIYAHELQHALNTPFFPESVYSGSPRPAGSNQLRQRLLGALVEHGNSTTQQAMTYAAYHPGYTGVHLYPGYADAINEASFRSSYFGTSGRTLLDETLAFSASMASSGSGKLPDWLKDVNRTSAKYYPWMMQSLEQEKPFQYYRDIMSDWMVDTAKRIPGSSLADKNLSGPTFLESIIDQPRSTATAKKKSTGGLGAESPEPYDVIENNILKRVTPQEADKLPSLPKEMRSLSNQLINELDLKSPDTLSVAGGTLDRGVLQQAKRQLLKSASRYGLSEEQMLGLFGGNRFHVGSDVSGGYVAETRFIGDPGVAEGVFGKFAGDVTFSRSQGRGTRGLQALMAHEMAHVSLGAATSSQRNKLMQLMLAMGDDDAVRKAFGRAVDYKVSGSSGRLGQKVLADQLGGSKIPNRIGEEWLAYLFQNAEYNKGQLPKPLQKVVSSLVDQLSTRQSLTGSDTADKLVGAIQNTDDVFSKLGITQELTPQEMLAALKYRMGAGGELPTSIAGLDFSTPKPGAFPTFSGLYRGVKRGLGAIGPGISRGLRGAASGIGRGISGLMDLAASGLVNSPDALQSLAVRGSMVASDLTALGGRGLDFLGGMRGSLLSGGARAIDAGAGLLGNIGDMARNALHPNALWESGAATVDIIKNIAAEGIGGFAGQVGHTMRAASQIRSPQDLMAFLQAWGMSLTGKPIREYKMYTTLAGDRRVMAIKSREGGFLGTRTAKWLGGIADEASKPIRGAFNWLTSGESIASRIGDGMGAVGRGVEGFGAGLNNLIQGASSGVLNAGKGLASATGNVVGGGLDFVGGFLKSDIGQSLTHAGRAGLNIAGLGLTAAQMLGYQPSDTASKMAVDPISAYFATDMASALQGAGKGGGFFAGEGLSSTGLLGRRLGSLPGISKWLGSPLGAAGRVIGRLGMPLAVFDAAHAVTNFGLKAANLTGLMGDRTYKELSASSSQLGGAATGALGLIIDKVTGGDITGAGKAFDKMMEGYAAVSANLQMSGGEPAMMGMRLLLGGRDSLMKMVEAQQELALGHGYANLDSLLRSPIFALGDAPAAIGGDGAQGDQPQAVTFASRLQELEQQKQTVGNMVSYFDELLKQADPDNPMDNVSRIRDTMSDWLKRMDAEAGDLRRIAPDANNKVGNRTVEQLFGLGESLYRADPAAFQKMQRTGAVKALHALSQMGQFKIDGGDDAAGQWGEIAASLPAYSTVYDLLRTATGSSMSIEDMRAGIMSKIRSTKDERADQVSTLMEGLGNTEKLKAVAAKLGGGRVDPMDDLKEGLGLMGSAGSFGKQLDSSRRIWSEFAQTYTPDIESLSSDMEQLLSRVSVQYSDNVTGDSVREAIDLFDSSIDDIRSRYSGIFEQTFPRVSKEAFDPLLEAWNNLPPEIRGAYDRQLTDHNDVVGSLLGINRSAYSKPVDMWQKLMGWRQGADGLFEQYGSIASMRSSAGDAAQRFRRLNELVRQNVVSDVTVDGLGKILRDDAGRPLITSASRLVYGDGDQETTGYQIGSAGQDAGKAKDRNREAMERNARSHQLWSDINRMLISEPVDSVEEFNSMLDAASPGLSAKLSAYEKFQQSMGTTTGVDPNWDMQTYADRGEFLKAIGTDFNEQLYKHLEDLKDEQLTNSSTRQENRAEMANIQELVNQTQQMQSQQRSTQSLFDELASRGLIRRHGGGHAPNSEFIAQKGEIVVTQGFYDKLFQGVDALSGMLSAAGSDSMATDAGQFMDSQQMSINGQVQHTGAVTLEIGDDANAFIQKLVELLAQSQSAPAIKVGDKIPNPLVGG